MYKLIVDSVSKPCQRGSAVRTTNSTGSYYYKDGGAPCLPQWYGTAVNQNMFEINLVMQLIVNMYSCVQIEPFVDMI